LEIFLQAYAVLDLVVVGVEQRQRIDEVALALALGADRLRLLDGGERRREVRLRRLAVRIVPQAERDTPIRDGAIGVGMKRLLEDFLRLLVPERMLVAHGAIEAALRRLVARGREMHEAEL